MRELKFRVWCEDEKRFNAYDYAFTTMKEAILEVHPNYDGVTIEQYTGLKDKNSKEIYEGDIVKYETVYEGGIVKSKGVVNFGYLDDTDGWTNGGYLCWRIDDWLSLDYGGRWIEVVGNIHENPELLKKKSKRR